MSWYSGGKVLPSLLLPHISKSLHSSKCPKHQNQR